MRRTIAMACVLAMTPGAAWAQQPDPHANPHVPQALQKTEAPAQPESSVVKSTVAKKKKRATAKKKQEAAAVPAQLPAQTTPPVPATLMNSTPVEPKVTMESGLLTIDAPNSTLSAVLSGVQKATGAAIEGASPSERVAVRLGPGDPEQVIAALLRGTNYDYVILGALGRQDVVTRVLLTQSTGGGQSAQGGSSGGGGSRPSVAARQQPPQEEEAEHTDDAGSQPDQAQQPQPQPQPNPEQPQTTQPTLPVRQPPSQLPAQLPTQQPQQ